MFLNVSMLLDFNCHVIENSRGLKRYFFAPPPQRTHKPNALAAGLKRKRAQKCPLKNQVKSEDGSQ